MTVVAEAPGTRSSTPRASPDLVARFYDGDAAARRIDVVAFGEMVGLLWNRGRRQDAEQGERSVPGAQQRADALRQEIDARVRAELEMLGYEARELRRPQHRLSHNLYYVK